MKVKAETESKTEERAIAYKIRESNWKKLKRENKDFKKKEAITKKEVRKTGRFKESDRKRK